LDQWIPKLLQLLEKCSNTDEEGTSLLMYALISWFARMTLRIPKIQTIVNEKNILERVMEQYAAKHRGAYDTVSNSWGATKRKFSKQDAVNVNPK